MVFSTRNGFFDPCDLGNVATSFIIPIFLPEPGLRKPLVLGHFAEFRIAEKANFLSSFRTT
jgi:hypothetical protein